MKAKRPKGDTVVSSGTDPVTSPPRSPTESESAAPANKPHRGCQREYVAKAKLTGERAVQSGRYVEAADVMRRLKLVLNRAEAQSRGGA
jgi:hypothetical protein